MLFNMIPRLMMSKSVMTMPLTFDLSVSKKVPRNIFTHSTNIDDQLIKISTWDHGGILGYSHGC